MKLVSLRKFSQILNNFRLSLVINYPNLALAQVEEGGYSFGTVKG